MEQPNILPRYKMTLGVEQFDALFLQDIKIQQSRSERRVSDLRRRLIKAQRFPMPYLVREMHGKEEYRAYTRIQTKKQPFREGIDFDSVVFFKNSRGTCAYINLDPFGVVEKRGVLYSCGDYCQSHRYLFTPHFFERYEMRHGWDGEFSDIHNQFFFNNLANQGAAFYTQMCDARPDDYKTVDVWSICNDGLMLGEVKSESDFKEGKPYIIQINTFLDFDTLTRRQDKYSNILKNIKEVFSTIPDTESEEDLKKRTFITAVKNL